MPTRQHKGNLVPALGTFTALMIVVGSVIGSGIFKNSASMSAELGAPGIMLAVWAIAGLVTLIGALTNAEISSMMPRAGGQYVYFRKMYGNFIAYLYGWSVFSVIQTGSIAAIAYIFSEYLGYFIPMFRLSPEMEARGFSLIIGEKPVLDLYPLKFLGVKLTTMALIMFLSLVNYFGVLLGAIQNLFTVLKVTALLFIIAIA